MIPDSLAPGIVIPAPDKTSARESGDEASWHERRACVLDADEERASASHCEHVSGRDAGIEKSSNRAS